MTTSEPATEKFCRMKKSNTNFANFLVRFRVLDSDCVKTTQTRSHLQALLAILKIETKRFHCILADTGCGCVRACLVPASAKPIVYVHVCLYQYAANSHVDTTSSLATMSCVPVRDDDYTTAAAAAAGSSSSNNGSSATAYSYRCYSLSASARFHTEREERETQSLFFFFLVHSVFACCCWWCRRRRRRSVLFFSFFFYDFVLSART